MSARDAITRSPGLPAGGDNEPAFAEPWQAQAFAFAVHLYERGLFSWAEWAETLGHELKKPGVVADGSDYYHCWMRALEALMERKGIASAGEIDAVTEAWHRAARATPHGQPIHLDSDPLRRD